MGRRNTQAVASAIFVPHCSDRHQLW
jgi:hypothetical protein